MKITTIFKNRDGELVELVFSNCINYTNRLGNSYVSFEYPSVVDEEKNPILLMSNYNTSGSLLENTKKTVNTLEITSETTYDDYFIYMGKYVSIDVLEDDIYKITINRSYLISITVEA